MALGVVGLMAIGGVAWAIYLMLSGVSGQVSSARMEAPTWDAVLQVTEQDADCSAAVSGGVLQVTMANAYPGSSCTFTGRLTAPATNTEAARVTGLVMTGLPQGWTASLSPIVCGVEVRPGSMDNAAFTIAMGETATTGQTATIGAGSGVTSVPASQYTAGACS